MTGRNKELSKLYNATWSEVKLIVDAADPGGLLEVGCPPDEYDDVVAFLVPQVLHGRPIAPTAVSAWFDTQYGIKASSVTEIVEALNSIQRRLDRKI